MTETFSQILWRILYQLQNKSYKQSDLAKRAAINNQCLRLGYREMLLDEQEGFERLLKVFLECGIPEERVQKLRSAAITEREARE